MSHMLQGRKSVYHLYGLLLDLMTARSKNKSVMDADYFATT